MHHRDLEAWKKSIKLVTEIYSETRNFPNEELYGLTSQIRRSAISVPSNIAEGCGRSTDKEAIRFMDIALGSLAELETQLIIASNLGFLKNTDLYGEISSINAMILGLKKYLLNKNN